MKKFISKFFNGSWRTTLLGLGSMAFGLHSFILQWVHGQTLYFNLYYVETAPIAVILMGIGLLHAKDHKCK